MPRIFIALLTLTFLVGCSEKNDDPEQSPSGETPADPKPLPRGPAHPLPANVYSFQISRGAGLGELSMGKVGSSAPRDAWKRYVHIRMAFDFPFPCNGIEVLRNGEPAFQSSVFANIPPEKNNDRYTVDFVGNLGTAPLTQEDLLTVRVLPETDGAKVVSFIRKNAGERGRTIRIAMGKEETMKLGPHEVTVKVEWKGAQKNIIGLRVKYPGLGESKDQSAFVLQAQRGKFQLGGGPGERRHYLLMDLTDERLKSATSSSSSTVSTEGIEAAFVSWSLQEEAPVDFVPEIFLALVSVPQVEIRDVPVDW